jgi:hypothetical protein
MTDFERLLRDLLQAIVIGRDGSFTWFGDRVARRSVPVELCLQDHLYWHFYVTGRAMPVVSEEPFDDIDQIAFVRELSSANCGSGVLERGWRISSRNGSTSVLLKDGLRVSVANERIFRRRGETVVRGLNELQRGLPGFYLALGNVELPMRDLLRVYWNVAPAGAAAFIRHVTRLLNDGGIAFRAKVVSDPRSFDRCDAAVVYVERRERRRIEPLLRTLYDELSPHLRPGVPALTKAIGRGVSVAEDPSGNRSFGTHRCRTVAAALVRAGRMAPDRRLGAIFAAFEQNGIAPHAPFLDAGSKDVYPILEP